MPEAFLVKEAPPPLSSIVLTHYAEIEGPGDLGFCGHLTLVGT